MTRPMAAVDWSSFPVDRSPRPLILLSSRATTAGFTTDEGKGAWFAGAVRAEADVPEAVALALVQRDGPVSGQQPDLVLDRAAQGTARFITDRGEADLPAWTLHGPGVLPAGVIVLDPSVQPWWSIDDYPEARGWLQRPALIDATGKVLQWTVQLPGGRRALRVDLEEHPTHVVARPVTTRPGAGRAGPVTLGLPSTTVQGHLVKPLGSRVLLSESLEPVAAVAQYWLAVE